MDEPHWRAFAKLDHYDNRQWGERGGPEVAAEKRWLGIPNSTRSRPIRSHFRPASAVCQSSWSNDSPFMVQYWPKTG
jgi:hypothetical protein